MKLFAATTSKASRQGEVRAQAKRGFTAMAAACAELVEKEKEKKEVVSGRE